jgi:uncharacterized protein YcbK (DUF882 family)
MEGDMRLFSRSEETDEPAGLTRRGMIFGATALALSALLIDPDPAEAAKLVRASERKLVLEHMHTGEKLKVVYWKHGRYIRQALKQVNHIMRDYRNNQVKPIDPKLLDLLWNLNGKLETREPYLIVSGYRSKETNRALRAHSDNVAKRSLHIQGKAIDIQIENRDASTIRRAALALKSGGVGYYPNSGFVHLDVGDVRSW